MGYTGCSGTRDGDILFVSTVVFCYSAVPAVGEARFRSYAS